MASKQQVNTNFKTNLATLLAWAWHGYTHIFLWESAPAHILDTADNHRQVYRYMYLLMYLHTGIPLLSTALFSTA